MIIFNCYMKNDLQDFIKMAHNRKPPTEEERLERRKKELDYIINIINNPRNERIINNDKNLTDIINWHDLVKGIKNINYPKTTIIKNLSQVYFSLEEKIVDKVKNRVNQEVLNQENQILLEASKMQFPIFIKTGLFSGKHEYKNTCYVEKIEDLIKNIKFILYNADCANCYHGDLFNLVLREFIPTKPYFYAFYGNLPINKEVRLFVKDEKIQSINNYWVKESFEGKYIETSIKNWQEVLDNNFKTITQTEYDYISKITTEITNKLDSKYKNNFWSIDFMFDGNKWWFIDLAEGHKSYNCNEKINIINC